MRYPRGFTLIEILVVLVIIGLMTSAVVLMGTDNRAEIARAEVEQVQAKLKLALEEAQLHGVEMGLVASETGYQFVTFGSDRWSAIADDPAYQQHLLPDGFELALQIEGFPLADGRLPGARITEAGTVVADGDEKDEGNKAGAGSNKKSDTDSPAETNGDQERAATTEDGSKETDPDAQPESLLPQVFLLSSGELNPFLLAIGNRDSNPVLFRLRGTADGNIAIEGPLYADLVDALAEPWQDPREDPMAKDEPQPGSSGARYDGR